MNSKKQSLIADAVCGSVPIGGGPSAASDPFYRYQRPVMRAGVEGYGGNGVKTVLLNLETIAIKHLQVPILYPLTFIGYEFSVRAKIDKSSRLVLSGAHSQQKVEAALEKFIHTYLICPKCLLPELNLTHNKAKQAVLATCRACGHCPTVNIKHKFTKWLMKDLQSGTSKVVKTVTRDTTQKRSSALSSFGSVMMMGGGTGSLASPGGDDCELGGAFGAGGPSCDDLEDDDVQWSCDPSAEAARQRFEAEFPAAAGTRVSAGALMGEQMGIPPGAGATAADVAVSLSSDAGVRVVVAADAESTVVVPPSVT